MDKAELRQGHVKALIEAYWKLRSYAVHDDDCTRNKPPRFRNCSCGLTAAIKAGERAADLLEVAEDGPPAPAAEGTE